MRTNPRSKNLKNHTPNLSLTFLEQKLRILPSFFKKPFRNKITPRRANISSPLEPSNSSSKRRRRFPNRNKPNRSAKSRSKRANARRAQSTAANTGDIVKKQKQKQTILPFKEESAFPGSIPGYLSKSRRNDQRQSDGKE